MKFALDVNIYENFALCWSFVFDAFAVEGSVNFGRYFVTLYMCRIRLANNLSKIAKYNIVSEYVGRTLLRDSK